MLIRPAHNHKPPVLDRYFFTQNSEICILRALRYTKECGCNFQRPYLIKNYIKIIYNFPSIQPKASFRLLKTASLIAKRCHKTLKSMNPLPKWIKLMYNSQKLFLLNPNLIPNNEKSKESILKDLRFCANLNELTFESLYYSEWKSLAKHPRLRKLHIYTKLHDFLTSMQAFEFSNNPKNPFELKKFFLLFAIDAIKSLYSQLNPIQSAILKQAVSINLNNELISTVHLPAISINPDIFRKLRILTYSELYVNLIKYPSYYTLIKDIKFLARLTLEIFLSTETTDIPQFINKFEFPPNLEEISLTFIRRKNVWNVALSPSQPFFISLNQLKSLETFGISFKSVFFDKTQEAENIADTLELMLKSIKSGIETLSVHIEHPKEVNQNVMELISSKYTVKKLSLLGAYEFSQQIM